MGKENLTAILEAAKNDFQNKNIVAFIGKPKSGKTVISTLLYDSLSDDFLRKYGKKFHVKIRYGHNEIDKNHRRMFTKGRFPPPTLPKTKSVIKYEIISREPLGTKVEFMIRDASGEDVQEIMQKEYDDPKELIKTILTTHKQAAEPYGPLSYLIFAKIFVILLDSEMAQEWKSEQLRYSQIITSIHDMKKYIDETVDDKIRNPIAIVLTKSDELKPNNQDTNKTKLTNEEFLEDRLPLFHSNLESDHMGKLGVFKFSINDVREATEAETKEIIEEENKEFNIQKEENEKEQLEIAKKERENKINQRVKNAIDKAREDAINQGHSPEEAENKAKQAGVTQRGLAEEAFPIDDFINTNESMENQIEFGKRFLIKLPVKYSQRECTRFISWLIESVS